MTYILSWRQCYIFSNGIVCVCCTYTCFIHGPFHVPNSSSEPSASITSFLKSLILHLLSFLIQIVSPWWPTHWISAVYMGFDYRELLIITVSHLFSLLADSICKKGWLIMNKKFNHDIKKQAYGVWRWNDNYIVFSHLNCINSSLNIILLSINSLSLWFFVTHVVLS